MSLTLTPRGHLRVDDEEPAGGEVTLRFALVDGELAPQEAWARAIGRLAIDPARHDPLAFDRGKSIALDEASIRALVDAVPPMNGAEYATFDVVSALARDTERALREAAMGRSLEAFLHERAPHLSVVGRVVLHLAENRRDPERPFAFIATYATKSGRDRVVQHRPIGEALREYATARDRPLLDALLSPVRRAAEKSALEWELLSRRLLFHPLAWTATEAHRLLVETPLLEEAGLVVRVPDWWRSRRGARPQVSVTIGKKPASGFGVDALLDVSTALTLDGAPLDEAEIEALLSATVPLLLLRGRWVEIDRERLQHVLAHWKKAQRAAREGIGFGEAMRLLSGADALEAIDAFGALAGDAREGWASIEAGPWLDALLAELRDPSSEGARPPKALAATLRPYQEEGARFLHLVTSLGLGALLADDMGLGKTLQVITLMLRPSTRRVPRSGAATLVVVPASLVDNWTREIARFAPTLRVRALGSGAGPGDLADCDVAIVTYAMLSRHAFLRDARFSLLVADEAQAIKNPAAKQTKALKSIAADARVALTGTPVENHLGDLWSISDFIDPGLLGSQKAFRAFAKKLEETGYAPLRRLIRPYVMRRLKSDPRVAGDLPDKTELRVDCTLTRKQAILYKESVEALAERLEDAKGRPEIEVRGVVLAALLRLKQICNHPSQWTGDGRYLPEESGKMLRLRAICEEIASRQEKVLVFTQFRTMTGPLAAFLETIFGRPGVVLHGETAPKKRMALVDEFQSESGAPFFVLSLKAGGTGLNLTAASHVVHFDRWWNPAVEDQATDRAHRIGQKRNVLVHKMVCRGTLEERIDALLREKRATSVALLAGSEELDLAGLPKDELLRLVSLDLDRALGEGASK